MTKEIRNQLLTIDERVFYGRGEFEDSDTWNCIIFGRRKMQIGSMDQTKTFFVAIVRENEMEEGVELKVIEAMKKIGLRLPSSSSIDYSYVQRAADTVVEIATMELAKVEKGCG